MTQFEQYRREIIEAAEFLTNNPDWEPGECFMHDINTLRPCVAIGLLVEGLTED